MEEMLALAKRIATLLLLRKEGLMSQAEEDELIDWLARQNADTLQFLSFITGVIQGQYDLEAFRSIDEDAALKEVLRRIFFRGFM